MLDRTGASSSKNTFSRNVQLVSGSEANALKRLRDPSSLANNFQVPLDWGSKRYGCGGDMVHALYW